MEIGRGSFANVYKGVDLSNNNKTVAIKSVFRNRLKNQKLLANLEIEIKILRTLKNPHIVSLLDCVKSDTHFHLIMDYCSLGDLSYFIKKKSQLANSHPIIKAVLEKYPSPENSDGLNQVLVINFIKQLSSALKFLRSQNLIHRDIKPQNLLLCIPAHSKDEFIKNNYSGFWELPILKVADFGFARYLPSTSMAETLCGSPLYMAPEILRYEKYNAKADLWSVGAVIYEMSVGKPPFRASNHIELLKKIEKSNDEINFPKNIDIPQDVIRLICNLLKANPIDRMGFNEFFNNPIITSNINLIESMNESISYSFENEEMYVSEFLVDKEKFDKNNKNIKNINNNKKNVNKTSYLPLNKLVIKEEDEEDTINDKESIPNYNNINVSSNNLKSPVSNGTVTKETIGNNLQPKNNLEKSVEKLLHEQQHKVIEQPINITTNYKKKNDFIVEKDYVVVEKRNVEINSFADEISKVSRPLERQSSSASNTQRKRSISVSPTSALKDVLDYTTEKLFGATNLHHNNSNDINNDSNISNNNNDNNIENIRNKVKITEMEPRTDINKIIIGNTLKNEKKVNIKIDDSNKDDDNIINKIEKLAMMAHSIGLYAIIKFNQVIPLPPSNSDNNHSLSNNEFKHIIDLYDYGYNNENKAIEENKGELYDIQNNYQYNLVYKRICQEGLVLYLKVLSLLGEAIKISNEWWIKNKFKSDVIPKMGELIQWIRNRFNESLEKAEYLKLRINRFEEEEKKDDKDKDMVNETEEEQFICEKIIFDRAIEISKDTAVKELKYTNLGSENNENYNIKELENCELSYSLSVWMLESLLYKIDDGNENILSPEDQKIIENFINSIGSRLLILKGKIDKMSS
jgi:serine/threonine-protein kinase ULK/ATG1